MILRELLVSFCGNELTIGIVLANWLISEAAGVFLIGKLVDKVKNKINVFIALQIVFSLALPAGIYLCRTFKDIIGVPFGEAIGLNLIYLASLFIILPVGFCHGALFSAYAKIYSSRFRESASAIGKVYTWEMLGTIIGGVTLTYLCLPYLNSFQTVFLISLINLAICLVFFGEPLNKKLKYLILACLVLAVFLIVTRGVDYLERSSIKKQWGAKEVLDYRNSIYGNIAVTRQLEQYTFYYNGIPVITAPFADITFVEEFGNLPLLFSHAPKEVLVLTAGAGGLIDQILKHPVKRIDYVELDPLIISMLKKYPTTLTEGELADKRVNIINLDSRFFLKTNKGRYDVILIGLSNQSDLSTNRLFTEEFFALSKDRLNEDGILAFWLPGSLTYLSQELRDLNACILNAARRVFRYVRIIPGDYNIFLASASRDIMRVSPGKIWQRIQKQNIKSNILIPSYLDYRLDKKWLDWFERSLKGATNKINQDSFPVAVYQMLIFWNKKFSPGFARILELLRSLNLVRVSIIVVLVTLLLFYLFSRNRKNNLAIFYSICTTGFFGMMSSLILTFSFQVYYGFLYYRIAILVSIFMMGLALGSMLMTVNLERIQNKLRIFMGLEALIIAFSFLLGLIVTRFIGSWQNVSVFFAGLFLATGILMGSQFPLAGKIYLREEEGIGSVSGALYAADLIGGWVAGVLGGIILLPVLGLFGACMVVVVLKLSSLSLLILANKFTL